MPQFHVTLRSMANVRAEFDIHAGTQEKAEALAVEDANSGNALWRYDGLAEDAPIEVDR